MTYTKKFDLEDRLVDFAANIIELTESMTSTRSANHLAAQLLRSGTAPALIYGEAQSAESHNDYIHKLKLVVKELRETFVALKITAKTKLCHKTQILDSSRGECNELIAIFVTSIKTSRKNNSEKTQ